MRARIDNEVLFLLNQDVPPYKKKGSMVRNSYFWALKSIADRAPFEKEWEFEQSVWLALTRMLTSFAESGYLGLKETQLEFEPDAEIPTVLKPMATWYDPADYLEDDDEPDENEPDGDEVPAQMGWGKSGWGKKNWGKSGRRDREQYP